MTSYNETTITDRDDLIAAAAEHLDATSYARGLYYGYAASETPGVVYLVDEDAMEELGKRLQADPWAYSRWCAETDSESTTAADLIGLMPEWRTDGSLDDLQGLKESAGSAGDYLTCAAVDHLAADLRALRSDTQGAA
jgi:hypothetical protein